MFLQKFLKRFRQLSEPFGGERICFPFGRNQPGFGQVIRKWHAQKRIEPAPELEQTRGGDRRTVATDMEREDQKPAKPVAELGFPIFHANQIVPGRPLFPVHFFGVGIVGSTWEPAALDIHEQ